MCGSVGLTPACGGHRFPQALRGEQGSWRVISTLWLAESALFAHLRCIRVLLLVSNVLAIALRSTALPSIVRRLTCVTVSRRRQPKPTSAPHPFNATCPHQTPARSTSPTANHPPKPSSACSPTCQMLHLPHTASNAPPPRAMPVPQPYAPDVAAKLAADVVSRLPPRFAHTDADRVRLTRDLAAFLSRCAPTKPAPIAPPTDRDNEMSP